MSDCMINGKKFQPVEYKILVQPNSIEDTDERMKSAKALGFHFIESEKEREQMKQITGTIVGMGGKACSDFGDIQPKIGDTVYFARYAGIILSDDQQQEFRLMNDKDVTGILI